jgi:hypothetical protein
MSLVISSAAGGNGDGLGALLAFDNEGSFLGVFSKDSRIVDPRGLAVNRNEGLLFLNSGSDRILALGSDGTVMRDTGRIETSNPGGVAFDPGERTLPVQLVSDPELSPLDLAIAPNGNIVVSSEHPFGALDAVTSVREYDARSGRLVRIFSAAGLAEFRRPRGLRFGPRGHLYCVAQDEVVSFDTDRGKCLGTQARFPRLHGQAIEFFP